VVSVALDGYHVIVAAGALDAIGDAVRAAAPAHRYAIVTDANVGPHYAARVRSALGADAADVFTVPAGEAEKTRATWSALTDELLAAGFGRDSAIVALGGGVVGDLSGFVAATYMRGIPYVQVPTSLLAMIDASIGGKTGVDTAAGKNLVGAFHHPAVVVVDPAALATLSAEHLRAGMAEAIKHGVIADEGYFERVRAVAAALPAVDVTGDAMLDLVTGSIEIKARVVRADGRESGIRKTLNFGHTVGHAVELRSDYTLLHGDAVAIGMAYESEIAERIGVAESGTARRVRDALRDARLPDAMPASIRAADVLAATRGDKKARAGRAEYALPTRVGAMADAGGRWSLPVDDVVVRDVLAP
jgi:3-dehydroquinate synthase